MYCTGAQKLGMSDQNAVDNAHQQNIDANQQQYYYRCTIISIIGKYYAAYDYNEAERESNKKDLD